MSPSSTSSTSAAAKKPREKAHPTPSLAGVFDQLLKDIVSGRYPAGSRLPAERDLSRTLGASRPTLREALRRLGEWRLIEAHRGSGVVVCPQRDWSLEVLPAFLRFGAFAKGSPGVDVVLTDLLALRRTIVVEVLRQAAPRLAPGTLGIARAAVEQAWEARHEVLAFARLDYEVLRAIVDGANLLPAVWLLNGLGHVYFEMAAAVPRAESAPADYLYAWQTVIVALEKGDGTEACRLLMDYFVRHDKRLLLGLGLKP